MTQYSKIKTHLLSRYHSRMEAMKDYLGGQCASCSSTEQLQIDHIDPTTKSFNLSKKWGAPWETLKDELAKCQLLCKQCHRLKTSHENSIKIPHNAGIFKHGSYKMRYANLCKCQECTDFHLRRMELRRKS